MPLHFTSITKYLNAPGTQSYESNDVYFFFAMRPITQELQLNLCSNMHFSSVCLFVCLFVQINLIAPPLYVMTTTTMERTEGLELLNRAIAKVEQTIKAAGGVFNVQNAPKVVTDMDELELEKQLKSLEEENREVDGDDDNDDDAAPPKVCYYLLLLFLLSSFVDK